MKNFLLQNVVFRADIFPVLWQFLKNAAKRQIFGGLFLAAHRRRKNRPS